MGLLKFLGDISTAWKINDKWGYGAADNYLKQSALTDMKVNEAKFNTIKSKMIAEINRFLNGDLKYYFNEKQRDKFYKLIDKVANCTINSFNIYADEYERYIQELQYPLFIQGNIYELSKDIEKCNDISLEDKGKFYELYDKVFNASSNYEKKINTELLLNHIKKFNIDFDIEDFKIEMEKKEKQSFE